MSKKQYTLTTPEDPTHSLAEAGDRVHRQVLTEEEVKVWLESWTTDGAPEFHLGVHEPQEQFNVRIARGQDTAEFTKSLNELDEWLRNYAAMDPVARVPRVEITRVRT